MSNCDSPAWRPAVASALLSACVMTLGCSGNSTTYPDTQSNLEHKHAHDHSHEHDQHLEALFGGEVVSIGHTHHRDGETYYYVEKMPIKDDILVIYFLVEHDGKLESIESKFEETTAYMGQLNDPPAMARETTFKAVADSQGYSTEIPEFLRGKTSIEVVFPRVMLGEENMSFNLKVGYPEADADSNMEAKSEGASGEKPLGEKGTAQ